MARERDTCPCCEGIHGPRPFEAEAGAISICGDCAGIRAFDEDLKLRKITPEECAALTLEERAAIARARQTIRIGQTLEALRQAKLN